MGVVIGMALDDVRAGVTGTPDRGSGRMGLVLMMGDEGWAKAWAGGIQVHPHHRSASCSMVLVVWTLEHEDVRVVVMPTEDW